MTRPVIDKHAVKQAATGRWPEIITSVANVSADVMDGKHHPCPKCGGEDRFRMFDDNSGGAICNQCNSKRCGDGFATLMWLLDVNFGKALSLVAGYLGIGPSVSNEPVDIIAAVAQSKRISVESLKTYGTEPVDRNGSQVVRLPPTIQKLEQRSRKVEVQNCTSTGDHDSGEAPQSCEDDNLEFDAALDRALAAVDDFDAAMAEPPVDNAEAPEEAPDQSKPLNLPSIAYAFGQTDAAHSERFIDAYHAELLYVAPWGKWLPFDGQRWHEDNGVGVLQRAKRYSDSLWNQLSQIAPHVDRDDLAKVVTAIKGANQSAKINSFLDLAAVDERVVCGVEELNSEPTLLNVANGTIDLTTGKLRPHNPADRITQLANVAYDPNATCIKWLETLSLIFDGKQDVIRYVQQLLGYSISGDTGEHILPLAWGKGCNGKSTIWNTVTELLGEYATLANDDLLLGEKSNHPTEKAALYQKRFVAISEPEKNSQLRESRVKELTGDRWITCRRMHEDFWSFQRTHTFWLSTNHLPRIDGTDEGIWRRVKLIPFTVDLRDKVVPIPDFDRWLVQHEGPGILAWLVRGYLDYRQHGLLEPECVTNATKRYRDDSDPLGDFLAEFCVEERGAESTATELFDCYQTSGGKWSKTAFGRNMAERFEKGTSWEGVHRGKVVYRGVRLREFGDGFGAKSENAKTHETQEKQGLLVVASSSSTPPRDLANPIEQCFNPLQPLATSKSEPEWGEI